MLKPIRVAVAALVAITGAIVFSPDAAAEIDVYSTEGTHTINGREWRTECEPYSVTHRCRTEIKATVVSWDGAKFVQNTDWAFNNLTYLASPRATWDGNPLATHNLDGFSSGGRDWRTECDTANTGRNGCRSYIEADVIASTDDGFKWQKQWIFNSMVRFGTPQPLPVPTPSEPVVIPGNVDIDPADKPEIDGWMATNVEGQIQYTSTSPTSLIMVMAVDAPIGEFVADLANRQVLPSGANCGTLGSTGAEVCLFISDKYGTVIVTATRANNEQLHAVTNAVIASLP